MPKQTRNSVAYFGEMFALPGYGRDHSLVRDLLTIWRQIDEYEPREVQFNTDVKESKRFLQTECEILLSSVMTTIYQKMQNIIDLEGSSNDVAVNMMQKEDG
ncbi:MAG: hypothetical protein KAS32_06955 [Candidatus Peribacteraceae bacterium]|nr:hypothetical protein [Candidatus Peribacteraceae bacterium]